MRNAPIHIFPLYLGKRFDVRFQLLFSFVLLSLSGASTVAVVAQTPRTPVLLSETTSTRAVALESVTWQREPFALNSLLPFGSDRRTRVMVFATNFDFAATDSLSLVSVEMEDGARRKYAPKVESVAKVPGHEWLSAVTVRLPDEMGEVGDVLTRITLRGALSNRVRIGIGRNGGGLADDRGAIPTPAPPGLTPQPTPTPSTTLTGAGPAAAADAVRFLEQATFGPTTELVERVKATGFRAFLQNQFDAPSSDYPDMTPYPGTVPADCDAACRRTNYSMYPLQVRFYQNAMREPDQLRQRVAFALHQIWVVSGREIQQPSMMIAYLRALHRNAFGSYRQLMYDITVDPAMGRYLDMVNNDKLRNNIPPNENYARELLQLFTTGTTLLNLNGTPKLDSNGKPMFAYEQEDVEELARVCTGWTWGRSSGATVARNPANYLLQMTPYELNHDTGRKVVLGTEIPAGLSAEKDLNAALDIIFNHPNVAPFISTQLIQHLVTSNPSPAYVERVARVFNDNGGGRRGDLRTVVMAILLDPEARGDVKSDVAYGHLREPVLYLANILRAFNAPIEMASTDIEGASLGGHGDRMGQNLFYAETVFNYYQPDYQIPGSKLLGPEFAIFTTQTAFARTNFVNSFVFSTRTPRLNLSAVEALADDPAKMLDWLDTLLLHGRMTPTMRAVATQAITSVPSGNKLLRAQTAIYLVLTSSQYQVER